jgi:pimeloyl-ACP methyl ester carboxylesterase
MLDQLGALAIAAMSALSEEARDAEADVVWSTLGTPLAPGLHDVRLTVRGDAVTIPHCSGRARVFVDGLLRDAGSMGPLELALEGGGAHDVRVEVNVSKYEKRIACAPWRSSAGLSVVSFLSDHRPRPFAGEAVLFVPRGHDVSSPGALLVGAHPWNGTPWTYASYRELIDAAEEKDVLLLMPSGRGNSLYTTDAENEVMRAIEFASSKVAVDPQRVSIWGASMGGAGATTIAFHRPDRFAFVASFFGDSKYDLTTYVRGILGDATGAHRVNALDVVDNARHLPVLLVHGEDDKSSPVAQSAMLHDAMKQRGFEVRFERVPGMGHEGPLVVRFVRDVVLRAATARAPERPARVTYRSVRPGDTQAYGIRFVRVSPEGDAFVDVERRSDGLHVIAKQGVSEVLP